MFNKFVEKLEIVGGRFGNLTYIQVIRDAFVKLVPIIILGSFATLVNNILCSPTNGLAGFSGFGWLADFSPIFNAINYATMNLIAIYVVFLCAYSLGTVRKADRLFCGIIGIICYVALVPTSLVKILEDGQEILIGNVLQHTYTNTQGMFLALFVGLLSADLFIKLLKSKKFEIHMPESVPPNVTRTFDVLFPALFVVLIFGIAGFVFEKLVGINISDGIYRTLQIPLEAIMQNPAGVIILALICQLFWFIGLHGANIIGVVRNPIGLAAIAANALAVEQGLKMENVFTYTFWNTFCTIGGSGNTIGLVIAIFLFSKREDERMMGKLSLVPALFNINEPLIFGLPLVLNPIYAIPFITAPVIGAAIGYFLTAIGFASPAYITIPFTVPPLISAFISTGSIGTLLTQGLVIIVSIIIYAPFVRLNARIQAKRAV